MEDRCLAPKANLTTRLQQSYDAGCTFQGNQTFVASVPVGSLIPLAMAGKATLVLSSQTLKAMVSRLDDPKRTEKIEAILHNMVDSRRLNFHPPDRFSIV